MDEFPNGYMTENPSDITSAKKRNNNSHTIVCIAEANTIPTRMWFHMIETFPEVLFFFSLIFIKLFAIIYFFILILSFTSH